MGMWVTGELISRDHLHVEFDIDGVFVSDVSRNGSFLREKRLQPRVRTLLRREFVELFDGGFDLVLTPTTPTSAFRLGEKTDSPLAMYLADVYTVTANLAGLPAISVPVGHDRQGMPLGAQLIGPDFGEDRLFAAASVLERRFPAGIPPWVEEHLPPGDGAAGAPV